jgi:hypothetical protein
VSSGKRTIPAAAKSCPQNYNMKLDEAIIKTVESNISFDRDMKLTLQIKHC